MRYTLGLLAALCIGACDPPGSSPTIPFACPSGTATIAPGWNSVMVNGVQRRFYVDFPADRSRGMGVVFSWHGFTDSVDNHRRISGLDPNGDPNLPLIIVTPDDIGLLPPNGLDWAIGGATPTPVNVDLTFFEAMLGCLNAQQRIDPARLYSFGFSAGSVMTSLLHSQYPKLLSAVVAESGAWFNDPVQQDMVNVFEVDWQWPALNPNDRGTVLLTHGGPGDVTILNVMNLENAAQAAFPFLRDANRVVVDCAHTRGHTLDPNVTPQLLSRFFSAHRNGSPSPYLSGGYSGFPPSCTLRLP